MQVSLIFGNVTADDVLIQAELDALAAAHPGQFRVWPAPAAQAPAPRCARSLWRTLRQLWSSAPAPVVPPPARASLRTHPACKGHKGPALLLFHSTCGCMCLPCMLLNLCLLCAAHRMRGSATRPARCSQ